jgi:hypothetical protein
MRISNCSDFGSSGCSTTSWINISTPYSWTLTSGDGLKNVYMQFRDNAGNISQTVMRSIKLDTTVPTTPTVSINNGAEYTDTDTVNLTISGGDGLSGVSDMYISRNGLFNDGVWEAFATTKSWDINGSGSYK